MEKPAETAKNATETAARDVNISTLQNTMSRARPAATTAKSVFFIAWAEVKNRARAVWVRVHPVTTREVTNDSFASLVGAGMPIISNNRISLCYARL